MAENTTQSNLIAGFRATGTYPTSKEHVLAKLPVYTKPVNTETEVVVGDAFKEYLNSVRDSDLSTVQRGRKFQLPVVPGKSVTAEEVEEYYRNRENAGEKPKGLRKRGRPPVILAVTNTNHQAEASGSDSDVVDEASSGDPEEEPNSKKGSTVMSASPSTSCSQQLCSEDNASAVVDATNGILETVTVEHLPEMVFVVGDHVVIHYEGEFFPGCVTQVIVTDSISYRVSAMQRSGNFWKWPDHKDEIIYDSMDVLKKIKPENVIPVTSRGVFKITDDFLTQKWVSL